MANSTLHVIQAYLSQGQVEGWIQASLVKKIGSGYRKSGAIMLIGPLGERLGLLSGGCLEKDIVLQARKVLAAGEPRIVEYNSLDDEYEAARFNSGCEGKLFIYLEPISEQHHLAYECLVKEIIDGRFCYLVQGFSIEKKKCGQVGLIDRKGDYLVNPGDLPRFDTTDIRRHLLVERRGIAGGNSESEQSFSITKIPCPTCLLIAGGGPDTPALSEMIYSLGWRQILWDDRPNFARRAGHSGAGSVLVDSLDDIADFDWLNKIDGAILKSHNLDRDAQWLLTLRKYHPRIKYIGLLGPKIRRDKILGAVAPAIEKEWLEERLFSPAGMDIGGDLPESLALSILAQCHSVVYGD